MNESHEWSLQKVLDLLCQAQDIALAFFHQVEIDYKEDSTLVTQADKAIEQMFWENLKPDLQNTFLIGEESFATRQASEILLGLQKKTAWILDPIDGTACYAAGLEGWGISLAFSRQGVLEEGAILMPLLGELFMTHQGETLYAHKNPGEKFFLQDLSPLRAKPNTRLESGILTLGTKIISRTKVQLKNPIHNTGCSVVNLTRLYKGSFLGLLDQVALWDWAAGLLMLKQADYHLAFLDGQEISLKIDKNNYELNPESPQFLRTRGLFLLSPRKESFQKLSQKINVLPS